MCNLKITSILLLLPTGASLLKKSVSTETAKVLHGTKVYEDREGDKEKREGLKWKLEHEWEGRHRVRKGRVFRKTCGEEATT